MAPQITLAAGALVLSLTLGFAAGDFWAARRGEVQLAHCQTERANALADAERRTREQLTAAAQAADLTVRDALRRAVLAETKSVEIANDIQAFTTGRDCLGAPARRLLARAPAFAASANGLPAPAGRPAGTSAAAGADPGDGQRASTDRDIAGWVNDAARKYENCRGRVDALRAWTDGAFDGRR